MRTLICTFVLFSSWAVPATPTPARFRDFLDYRVTGTPAAVTTADLNDDGIPDAIVATAEGVDVLLGAVGGFQPATRVTGGSATAVVVGDFNNDGHLDILAAMKTTSGSELVLALGNGNGTFQRATVLPNACFNCSLAVGDFNNDGLTDVAVANTTSLTILLSNGNGTFQNGPASYTFSEAVAVTVGNLNGDSTPDLVIVDAGLNQAVVLLGNGNATFLRSSYSVSSGPTAAVINDFNLDGLNDIAVNSKNGDTVTVLTNLGKGSFKVGTPVPAGCATSGAPNGPCTFDGLATGDFNGDGLPDLATPDSLLYGKGDGTFQAPILFAAGNTPTYVTSFNFNSDNKTDLVVANKQPNISLLFGLAESVLQPGFESVGASPQSAAEGDFNGDGNIDIAVASYSSNTVQILLGGGKGGFRAGQVLSVAHAAAVLALDLNGDGLLDLAVSSDLGTTIFFGDGNGTFTQSAEYALTGDCTQRPDNPTPQVCFASADVNGDGHPDLAGASWSGNTVSTLLNNGDGTFRSGTTLNVETPQGLTFGDFNNDGHADLAVSSYYQGEVIFPGFGNGSFGSSVTVQIAPGAVASAVGDFNGDGNLDLAVAPGAEGGFAIYVVLGDGNLTFSRPKLIQADEEPIAIAVGDLNNDGLPDIVSTNYPENDVALILNSGGGAFAPATFLGTGNGPCFVVVGDLNGDQKQDILAVDNLSANVAVILNTTQ